MDKYNFTLDLSGSTTSGIFQINQVNCFVGFITDAAYNGSTAVISLRQSNDPDFAVFDTIADVTITDAEEPFVISTILATAQYVRIDYTVGDASAGTGTVTVVSK